MELAQKDLQCLKDHLEEVDICDEGYPPLRMASRNVKVRYRISFQCNGQEHQATLGPLCVDSQKQLGRFFIETINDQHVFESVRSESISPEFKSIYKSLLQRVVAL